MDFSEAAYEAGKEAVSANIPNATAVLNNILNRFLGWPFKAAKGCAVDRAGKRTEIFDSLVYTTSEAGPSPEPLIISADNLAAVIDVSENLDLDRLRAAYQKIAFAKALKKSPAPTLKGSPAQLQLWESSTPFEH